MVRFLSLAALLTIALEAVAPRALAAESKPCGLTRYVSVDLSVDPPGRLLVPVTIQGVAERMVLDTGNAASMISAGAADRLKLAHQPMHGDLYVDATGQSLRDAAKAASFQLGPVKFDQPSFLLMPADTADDSSAGRLGADLLHYVDVDIDPAHHAVNLFSPDHCPGQVVYWTKDYIAAAVTRRADSRVLLRMMLNDKPIDALLDTGSERSVMTLDVAAALFGVTPDSPGVEPGADIVGIAGQAVKSYTYRFASLAIQGLVIRNPSISLIADRSPQAERDDWRMASIQHETRELPSFTLGMGTLRQLHFYIAFGESRFYASTASAQ